MVRIIMVMSVGLGSGLGLALAFLNRNNEAMCETLEEPSVFLFMRIKLEELTIELVMHNS